MHVILRNFHLIFFFFYFFLASSLNYFFFLGGGDVPLILTTYLKLVKNFFYTKNNAAQKTRQCTPSCGCNTRPPYWFVAVESPFRLTPLRMDKCRPMPEFFSNTWFFSLFPLPWLLSDFPWSVKHWRLCQEWLTKWEALLAGTSSTHFEGGITLNPMGRGGG